MKLILLILFVCLSGCCLVESCAPTDESELVECIETGAATIELQDRDYLLPKSITIDSDVKIYSKTSVGSTLNFNNKWNMTVLGNLTLENLAIIGTRSNADGGAIFLQGIASSFRLTLFDVKFINCSTSERGGALYVESVQLVMDNVTFISNTARQGGAIYSHNAKILMRDVNFYENTANDTNSNHGGALYIYALVQTRIVMQGTINFIENKAARGFGMIVESFSDSLQVDATDAVLRFISNGPVDPLDEKAEGTLWMHAYNDIGLPTSSITLEAKQLFFERNQGSQSLMVSATNGKLFLNVSDGIKISSQLGGSSMKMMSLQGDLKIETSDLVIENARSDSLNGTLVIWSECGSSNDLGPGPVLNAIGQFSIKNCSSPNSTPGIDVINQCQNFSTPHKISATQMDFMDNSGLRGGGFSVHSERGLNLQISARDLAFSGNSVSYGGGMYVNLEAPELNNITFECQSTNFRANRANQSGGAIWSNKPLTDFYDKDTVTFESNRARQGCFLYLDRNDCIAPLDRATIRNNKWLANPVFTACPVFDMCSDTSCTTSAPGSGWYCNQGTWIFIGDININNPTVINSATNVIGNLTLPGASTITFNGPKSSLNVSGCATINGTLQIVLNDDDVSPGSPRELALLESSCLVSNPRVTLKSNAKSCKKITQSSKSTETSQGRYLLTSTFEVNDSRCKLWWIILLSVVGGVLLILIVLAILFTRVKAMRESIRPFSKRAQK